MVNLYLVHTINMPGDAVIELYASELPIEELNEVDDTYSPYLGTLDEEDAYNMIALGYNPEDGVQCVTYANVERDMAIPPAYKLIIVNP